LGNVYFSKAQKISGQSRFPRRRDVSKGGCKYEPQILRGIKQPGLGIEEEENKDEMIKHLHMGSVSVGVGWSLYSNDSAKKELFVWPNSTIIFLGRKKSRNFCL
jgi:hypothetical protein